MKRFIKKLKEKPDHHKNMIAFGTSGAVTLVIFTLWIYTFSFQVDREIVAKKKIDFYSPFETISETTASVFSAFKKQIGGIKEEVKKVNDQYASGMVQTYTTGIVEGEEN